MSAPSTERLIEITRRMIGRRVIVFGDVMLDEFVWGDVTRISPEAPVPVVDIRRDSVRLGGAANVLANLIALNADGAVVGVIGQDQAGERLRIEIEKVANDGARLVSDQSRPTTIKTRIIAHNQLVVRADRESRAPVAAEIETQLIQVLEDALKNADALVISDYDKGAVTPVVLRAILAQARERGTPVLVDPKTRNFAYYRRATLITPNHHEALRLSATDDDTDEGIARAAAIIRETLHCPAVLVTRGEQGMMLSEADKPPVYVGTAAREVYDVTGAGDTVIATLAAAVSAGATLTEAATLANYAAGIVVGKLGTATASTQELVEVLR